MATTTVLSQVLELVDKFVTSKKGSWDHSQWESFLASVAKTGVALNDESKRVLGNLLETAKFFYVNGVVQPATKAKTAEKPKASAKPKAKVKAKAKTKTK